MNTWPRPLRAGHSRPGHMRGAFLRAAGCRGLRGFLNHPLQPLPTSFSGAACGCFYFLIAHFSAFFALATSAEIRRSVVLTTPARAAVQ